MEKRYSILSQDKVFDGNIILDYTENSYCETEQEETEHNCSRSSEAGLDYVSSTGLRDHLQTSRERKNNKDIVFGALNVADYHSDQNCNASNSSEIVTGSIKKPKTNCSGSQPSELDSSICDGLGLTKSSGSCLVIAPEQNQIQPCSKERLTESEKVDEDCLVIERDNEKGLQIQSSVSNSNIHPKTDSENENCFLEQGCVDTIVSGQSKQVNGKNTLDVKFLEKEEHIDLNVGSLEEQSAMNNNDEANVLNTEGRQQIAVGSNLQFLNTGGSIVVLTQDANNIGLSAHMGDVAVPDNKQIELGQYEFSAVPTEINSLSGALTDSQPTFFQVELYNTSSLQTTTCHVPATVISAQQVLTVPQLFSCHWEGCNTHFLSKEDLVAHVTAQHAKPVGPQEYKCLWKGCSRDGKIFDARYKILTHLRSHTGERPHVCMVEGCHKSFARLDNLKIHTRSHTGERPYTCPYEGCNKSYANSSDRFKHTRTHLEKKPYRCKFEGCDKSYTDPSSLRKHQKRHKNDRSKILLADVEPIIVLPTIGNADEIN